VPKSADPVGSASQPAAADPPRKASPRAPSTTKAAPRKQTHRSDAEFDKLKAVVKEVEAAVQHGSRQKQKLAIEEAQKALGSLTRKGRALEEDECKLFAKL
jgi:ribosomal protein S20